MTTAEPDIYSFFVSFKEYKYYEKEMEERFLREKDNSTCDSFSSDTPYLGNESAKNICIKFKIFHNIIETKKKKIRNPSSLDDKDYAFLNYWLNNISRNTKTSSNITVHEFQTKMSDIEEYFTGFIFDEKLYDIEDEDFNNMSLLNELQYNYGEIFTHSRVIVKGDIPCIGYFKKFMNTYKNCIIKCPDDDTSFCRALKHIKGEYKQTFLGDDGISKSCTDREKLHLPSYNDVSTGNKITIVGTILGPSFGTLSTLLLLYKFTPLGQWILAKIGTNKGAYNNLYEKNDKPLPYNSYNEYINSDYNEYQISYDSVVNS
ncbi:PIR protein [Plasmodium ovale]|uniref:PIR Superfamily Protein n=2 Tax=Plasmodium ovale TaxID=36330 RepID=A0A1A8X7W9_PLAOA|nr:PIR Superfamily Protein [Plasmodium ovale curtisi]SBT84660.1 PIR protein [Plasmodium ovale]